MRKVTARFSPQAWVNNNAIECDPEGDTEWDATNEFWIGMPAQFRDEMLPEMAFDPSDSETLDGGDWLKNDPNAPEWIREWRGPFSIYVRFAEPDFAFTDEITKGSVPDPEAMPSNPDPIENGVQQVYIEIRESLDLIITQAMGDSTELLTQLDDAVSNNWDELMRSFWQGVKQDIDLKYEENA